MTTPSETVLLVTASARKSGSTTRELADRLLAKLYQGHPGPKIVTRDVADGLPLIDEDWVGANFTDPADRTDAQRAALALSDTLVSELRAADTIVIAAPVYNFGVPASLKAWIDLVARARETFRYTENGPVGLLNGKKAYVIVASGGTPIGSEIDFTSGYLKHILGFIGISDVEIVGAGQQMADPDAVNTAVKTIENIAENPTLS